MADPLLPPSKYHQLEVPDLSHLDGCRRAALLVRHAARYGRDVALHTDGLTPEGREAAMRLGKRIGSDRKLRLFSSPVQRCVDTASLIAKGAGSDAEVSISTMLGKPGTYVIDEKQVDEYLAVMGLHGFAVEWVRGKIPTKAMAPVAEGSEELVRWVARELLDEEERLDIYVGHDLFLTPVLVHYTGYDISTSGLLGFLDGFTVGIEGGRTVLRHGGKRAVL